MIECVFFDTSYVLPFNHLDHTIVEKYTICIVVSVFSCNYTRKKFIILACNQSDSFVFLNFIRQIWFTMACNYPSADRFNVILQWNDIFGNFKSRNFLFFAIGDISDGTFFTIRIQFNAWLPWCNDVVVSYPFCIKWTCLPFIYVYNISNSQNYCGTQISCAINLFAAQIFTYHFPFHYHQFQLLLQQHY